MPRILTVARFAAALLIASLVGTASPARAALFRERVVDHWPGAIVPFFLHESLTQEQRATFAIVAEYVELMTNIRFEERATNGPGVLAIRQHDESEYVAWSRTIRWSDASRSTLLHEFSHAMGLQHEQQRTDRDDAVEVLFHNIRPLKRYAYDRLPWPTPIGDFDFDSIMMYNSCDFRHPDIIGFCGLGMDDALATMIRNEPDPETGSRLILVEPDRYSATDLRAIHQFYSGFAVDALDVTLESAAEAAAFCGVAPNGRIIVGDVTLSGPDSLVIPCLQRVVGSLTIQGFQGEVVELPSLVSVHGTVRVVDAPDLALLDLSALRVAHDVDMLSLPSLDSLSLGLEVVFGSLLVSDLLALRTLDLSSLRRVADLTIGDNAALRTIVARNLHSVATHPMFEDATVGTLQVAENPALELLSVSQLQLAGVVSIEGNAQLRQVNLPALGHEASGAILRVEVLQNTALEGVSLDSLANVGTLNISENSNEFFAIHVPVLDTVYGRLRVASNPFLTRLEASQLKHVFDPLEVTDNRRLTHVQLPALTATAALVVVGNEVLHTIDLPVLESVDVVYSFSLDRSLGFASFRDNPALTALALPALVSTSASLTVESCAGLSTLDLAQLVDTRDLLIAGTSLLEVWLPTLTTVGDVTIASNSLLESVKAPQLADGVGIVRVIDNAALWLLGARLTDVEGLVVVGNGHAAASDLVLALPWLTDIGGSFEVDDNPRLQSFRFLDPGLWGNLDHVAGDARLRTAVRQAAEDLVANVPRWDGSVLIEDL